MTRPLVESRPGDDDTAIRCFRLEARLEDFAKLMDERDRRYGERAGSQDRHTSDGLETAKEIMRIGLTTAERAVEKAAVATEKRFDSVNEFRAQLKDYQAELITRVEVTGSLMAVTQQIVGVETQLRALIDRNTLDIAQLRTDYSAFVGQLAGYEKREDRGLDMRSLVIQTVIGIATICVLIAVAVISRP